MKIVLCNPEVRQEYSHSRKGMYPPLGLLSLATCLKKDHSGSVEVQIIDGDVEAIHKEIFRDTDIIGFHANSFNYENCLDLAQEAKGYGAKIVLGGPHASVLWKNIMEKRPYVDFIVVEEGEIAMSLLVKHFLNNSKGSFDDIPNLVYRKNGGEPTKSSKVHINTPEEMITPSRKFIKVESYIQNYRKVYTKEYISFERPLSIYSSKGCSWRDKTGGCVFCARLEKGVRFRNIAEIWNEIRRLKEQYKTDYIWDISDDNLNSPQWFKSFVEQRTEDLSDISFLIYSRVNRITEDIIPYLKRLNVYEVYLGIESGDDEVLRNTLKGASSRLALNAAQRLKDAGIYYFPSFVLGLPGETEKSLGNTLNFAENLAKIGSIFRMSATILMPIPGSQVYSMLLKNPIFGAELSVKDIISIKELEKLWIENYTDVEYATAEKYQKMINEVVIKVSGTESFGVKVDG
jgi:radical SAM superfamily enzyme YgiQ (UPF0313 family)